jgi:hypothetical protein
MQVKLKDLSKLSGERMTLRAQGSNQNDIPQVAGNFEFDGVYPTPTGCARDHCGEKVNVLRHASLYDSGEGAGRDTWGACR